MKVLVKKTDGLRHEVAQAIAQLGVDARPIYSTSPEEVIRLVEQEKSGLVVSGQVFRWRMTGTELAKEVKARCPDVLFFVWSQHAVDSPYVDAVISDGVDSVNVVARIFAQYRVGMTLSELERCVPEIVTNENRR